MSSIDQQPQLPSLDKDGIPRPFPKELRDLPTELENKRQAALEALTKAAEDYLEIHEAIAEHVDRMAQKHIDPNIADPRVIMSVGIFDTWSKSDDIASATLPLASKIGVEHGPLD